MDIAKNILFATATGGGVYSIDISDPYNPYIRDYYSSHNLTHEYYKIRYANGLLITSVISGMMLINAENPDSLKQISYFATTAALSKIKLKDNYAFIACGKSGLWILDISDPYHPNLDKPEPKKL